MKRSGKGRGRTPKQRPSTVEEGVGWLRAYVVDLFDKGDGHEADWPVMAQTVFATAFALLDEAKGDDRAMKVLRRVEVSLYHRLAGKPADDDLPPAVEVGGPRPAPDPLRPAPLPEPRLRP